MTDLKFTYLPELHFLGFWTVCCGHETPELARLVCLSIRYSFDNFFLNVSDYLLNCPCPLIRDWEPVYTALCDSYFKFIIFSKNR